MRIATFIATLITCAGLPAWAAPADDRTPEALFKRLGALAATGNAEAKYNLGMFLNNGIGTARDSKAAFRYFSEAAAAGHELAAYKVGCYFAGQFPGVVPTDEAEALKFKLRAASAGYELAQQDVGMHFGKKGDLDNAILWWEQASRQANRPATAFLAKHFSEPSSPNRPQGLALAWLLREQGTDVNKALLDHIAKLEAQLSAAEKAEAERIRAAWVTGPTPLTAKARAGMQAVPALLDSLER